MYVFSIGFGMVIFHPMLFVFASNLLRSHFGTPFALFCPDHCLWHLWLGIPWKATWISLLSEWADLLYHHEFHHQALCIYDIGRNPIQWISRSPAHDACEYSNVLQTSCELWRPDTSSFRLTKSSFGSSGRVILKEKFQEFQGNITCMSV